MNGENNIPGSWQCSLLVDCCTIVLGQSPSSKTYNTEGKGLPFFQGKAEFGPLYPTPEYWCSEPSKVAEQDDVLLSVRAPVGPTNLAPAKCCIGRGLAAIRPAGGILNRYMLYAFRNIEKDLDELGTGTTFKAITGLVVRSLSIPVAPVPEQRRIVEEIEKQFTRLDAGVAALKRVEANLRRYKAAVLKAAVEGRLTEKWRAEHPDVEPASELLKRILTERRRRWEQSELAKLRAKGKPPADDRWKKKYREPIGPEIDALPPLPHGWTWTTIEQACDAIVDCPHATPTWTESGKVCVRTTEFRPGALVLDSARFVSDQTFELRTARLRPRAGDVLYSREGGILGIACVIPNGVEICLGQRMMLMRATINGTFLMHWMNSPFLLSRVSRLTGGSASPHLNVADIKAFPVPFPPAKEQDAVVEAIEAAMTSAAHQEEAIAHALRRASRLRHSILKRAFEGKLVLQDPTDEPASVLLDRIRAERQDRTDRTPRKGGPTRRLVTRRAAR